MRVCESGESKREAERMSQRTNVLIVQPGLNADRFSEKLGQERESPERSRNTLHRETHTFLI